MRTSPSVVTRLLWALIGSLTAVAIVVGVGGSWLINGIAESTSDRLLGASARAIAETLAVDGGQITLDLPPFALGMLENNERDNVYYSVRHNGRLLTGYPDMPSAPPPTREPANTTFRYADFRGARIRIASEVRSLPRIDGLIVVEVAETLDARHELARRMLLGLSAVEALIVGVAALLVWPAAMWSLRPITRLQRVMDARRADFTALPVMEAPSELAGLVIGFNALLERLDASLEGIRRFTADASHQMRTPLAVLRTHLSLVKRHGLDSEVGRTSLADLELAIDRLQGLLTGLIALARAEDGDDGSNRTNIDLRTIVRNAARDVSALAVNAKVSLSVSAPRGRVSLVADPLLVGELLSNLLDNAIRYNRPGGSVNLSIKAADHDVVITVEDDGPGIPPEDRPRALGRFYRLARDQRHPGSGLGLSIAQAIAKRLRAQLELGSSSYESGLKVTVTFTDAEK